MNDTQRRLLIANVADTCSRMLENVADLDDAFARACPQLELAQALCNEVQEQALRAAAVGLDAAKQQRSSSTTTGVSIDSPRPVRRGDEPVDQNLAVLPGRAETGPRRWKCRNCGNARRRSVCLNCGSRKTITDEQPVSGLVE